jgi:hypothetical protein
MAGKKGKGKKKDKLRSGDLKLLLAAIRTLTVEISSLEEEIHALKQGPSLRGSRVPKGDMGSAGPVARQGAQKKQLRKKKPATGKKSPIKKVAAGKSSRKKTTARKKAAVKKALPRKTTAKRRATIKKAAPKKARARKI